MVLLLGASIGCSGVLSNLKDGDPREMPPSDYSRSAAAVFLNQPEKVSFDRAAAATCAQEPTSDLKIFCSAKKNGDCNGIQNADVKAVCKGQCGWVSDPGYKHTCARRSNGGYLRSEIDQYHPKECEDIPKTNTFYSWCIKPIERGPSAGGDPCMATFTDGPAGSKYRGKDGRTCSR